jgi:D-threonate/D-erythronate kinase
MQELRRIAALVRAFGVRCIWVGSGGLAQALANVRTNLKGPMPPRSRPSASFVRDHAGPGRGGMVFAVGSFSDVAREQVRRLVRAGGVEQIALGIPTLLAAGRCPDIRVRIDAALSRGADVAVCIDPAADVQPALATSLARALASTIAPQLDRLGALVVCGGDTSRALLDHIGADRLTVQSSKELGATRASTALHPGLPIILKAGAFGDEELLVRLRQQLSEPAPSR